MPRAAIWATAKASAMRAKIDKEVGWHKTLSNVAVTGVEGMTKQVFWSLQDPTPTRACSTPTMHLPDPGRKGSASGARTRSGRSPVPVRELHPPPPRSADTIAEAHTWAGR